MSWTGAEASTQRWRIVVRKPAAGVLHSVVSGHLDVEGVGVLADAFDAVAAESAPVTSFHDWFDVTGYDPAAREKYQSWAKPHRAMVNTVHILVGSRFLAMGIRMGNLVLGGYLQPYHRREPWQRMLDAHLGLRA